MKIIKLELVGYKPFDLLGVDKIIYTPESPYQLIIGKNGIGKSRLLNELSPLPVEASDLKEGGYKRIVISHRGKEYILTNEIHKKLDNSFIVDGIELNEGGTTKAQKDLVWEHFQYDNNLHDMLIGNTLLSNMSPQQRREWFVKMSKSDISFVIGLYNRLKGTERDIKGGLKLNNQRLVSEQAKLPSAEDIKRVRLENEQLKEELNVLLPNLDNQLTNLDHQLMQCGNEILKLGKELVNCNLDIEFRFKKGKKELSSLLTEYRYSLDGMKNTYKTTIDELTQLQDILNKHEQVKSRPIEDINNEINHVRQLIDTTRIKLNQYNINIGQQASEQLLQLQVVREQFAYLYSQLPANPKLGNGEHYYTRREYDELSAKNQQLITAKLQHQNRIQLYKREIENLEQVHDVNCPNCHTVFKPGVDCSRINKGKMFLQQEEEKLHSVTIELDKLQVKLEEYAVYWKVLNGIRAVIENYPLLNPLFDYLSKQEGTKEHPNTVLTHVDDYYQVLILKNELERYEGGLTQLDIELTKRKAAEGTDIEYIRQHVSKLEEKVYQTHVNIQGLEGYIKEVSRILQNTETIESKTLRLKQLTQQLRQDTLSQLKYENNEKLKSIIYEKQSLLANNENFVNRVNQGEAVIEQLTLTNEQLMEEQKCLQVLTTLLSPQDGLIAESLLGFIHQFLNQMVNVLDQIWTYSMRPYIDLGEDGIELDYRFPVDINEGDIHVKDVSRLSRGQKEVVDFIFKLLLLQHLNLQDYPLIMDEVGASFDDLHRDRLYRYIKLLVESNQVQQVFIVSHIASSHDALTSADKCVLNIDATMVDAHVNKVLQFK